MNHVNSDAADKPHCCHCGWIFPKALQLGCGGMDRVLVSCGVCGLWWSVTTSITGGWWLEHEGPPTR